jgi:endonuclease YncB( thermonuclease family)
MGEVIRIGCVQFIDVPDYFLDRYDDEIAAWAVNFRKIGPVKSFVLREGYFADASPNEEYGAALIRVQLLAKVSRRGIEIAPYRERDRRNIARHCEKMIKLGIPARARLKEPPRPWLPFMPKLVKQ